ncbi:MAG: hypothetical protein AD073_000294 [Mycoplasmataceae bacterium]|nr:MAG: hypothetical protein AD073_000294 [Mycoplasmataceae bacterium]
MCASVTRNINKNSRTKNISLTLNSEIYHDLKDNIPQGQLSSLANSLFKEWLKEKKKNGLISSYKSLANSKIRKNEYKDLEGTIEDGVDNW